MVSDSILDFIRKVILEESSALRLVADQVDRSYLEAIDVIRKSSGKVIVSGVGKSGHIARKIAATMSSTGTLAVFLHPADAQHGDLGVVSPNDVVIALSKSGETEELLMIVPVLKRMGCKIIAVTAGLQSSLAKGADVVLSSVIQREAGHLELAPTTSTTVSLAIGDALAMALMKLKNFQPEDFALFHPGGQLGRQLLLRVEHLMIPIKECPVLNPEKSSIEDLIGALGAGGLGIVIFSRDGQTLDGILTDGDVRRALSQHRAKIFDVKVVDLMNKKPTTITSEILAVNALKVMEERPRPLNVIPVVDNGQLRGLVRLHELLKLK